MASNLTRWQAAAKWVQQDGTLHPQAVRLLNDLVARVGGATANTNTELATSVTTAIASAATAQAAATAAQADIDATQALTFLLASSSALITNGRVLTAGIGNSIDTATAGQIKVNSLYFPVMTYQPGIPTASQIVFRVRVPVACSAPANLTGSFGDASATFTAAKSYDIQKNGSSFGSLDFALGAQVATFSTSLTSFAAGDLLTIVAPAVPDVTGTNVGFSLRFNLT